MAAIRVAASLFARLRGLFRRTPAWLEPSAVLVLVPCRSIHTFGMRQPIDVAFADERGVILRACTHLPPARVVSCRGACLVLERYTPQCASGETVGSAWYRQGDTLELT